MMKDFLKKITLNAVASAVLCVLLGLVLVIWPGVVGRVFCYVVGGLLLLSGVVYIVSYFRQTEPLSVFQVDFLLGLMLSVLGVWILLRPDMVLSLIPVFFGIVMLLHGLVDVQQTLNLKRAGYQNWVAALILSIVTILFGVVLLFNPLQAANAGIILLGVGLIFDGASDLWVLSRISKYLKE